MTTPTREHVWTGSTGCTIHLHDLDNARGTCLSFNRELGKVTGVLVRLDETGDMCYLHLSEIDRNHATYVSAEKIDRDRFDHLTGLDRLRCDMGWPK